MSLFWGDGYPDVKNETDNYVDFFIYPDYRRERFYGQNDSTRERKGLVVGGPLDGERLSRTQVKSAAPWGYKEFNSSGGSNDHKFIFAWIGER